MYRVVCHALCAIVVVYYVGVVGADVVVVVTVFVVFITAAIVVVFVGIGINVAIGAYSDYVVADSVYIVDVNIAVVVDGPTIVAVCWGAGVSVINDVAFTSRCWCCWYGRRIC